jgi:heme oxygenase (biliverdin-IX-beta and delta-forming)
MSDDAAMLARLKQQTAAHHRRVERCFPILHPGLSLADYIAWLECLYGFHAPFEEAIAPWAEQLAIDWDARRKVPWLRRDLAILRMPAERLGALPMCRDLPELPGLEEVFGALYVLEGATLGGRFIAQHLTGSLGVSAAAGCAYFVSYGEELEMRWQAFCARLTVVAAGPDAERRVIGAACRQFEAFERWILRAGPVGAR